VNRNLSGIKGPSTSKGSRFSQLIEETMANPGFSLTVLLLSMTTAVVKMSKSSPPVKQLLQIWVPNLLLVLYILGSLYLYTTTPVIELRKIWFSYLCSNALSSCMALLEASESRLTYTRAQAEIRGSHALHDKLIKDADDSLPCITLVYCAYLPNEKDIILQTLEEVLQKSLYPKSKLKVALVYNTPVDLEVEKDLRRMAREVYENLIIDRVPMSTTKPDNLNYFLASPYAEKCDIIALFDADHIPAPESLLAAAHRLKKDSDVHVIQGRCIVYNARASTLTGFFAVDQDLFSTIWQPGRAQIWGQALFTGSNGYWRAPVLRSLRLSPEAIIEDVDLGLRAVMAGHTIVHDDAIVSYELGVGSWKSWSCQRLRWAQGYARLARWHVGLPFRSNIPIRVRLGVVSLLWVRELNHYCVTQHAFMWLTFVLRLLFCWRDEAWKTCLLNRYYAAYFLLR
jgi:cellulose synthase/poly-beta-1,6-N-acetylglucosamine synthase-like glycosyltransferase